MTAYTTKDRLEALEKIAPFREIGLKKLSTMRKKRIDNRTVILVPKENK
jgi:hypothetical protein